MSGPIKLLWHTASKEALEWYVLLGLVFTGLTAMTFLCGGEPWAGLEVLEVLCVIGTVRQAVLLGRQVGLPKDAPSQEHIRRPK